MHDPLQAFSSSRTNFDAWISSVPPSSPVQHPHSLDDLLAYLSSVPQSSCRKIDDLAQPSTVQQVWRAFRSKNRLFVAPDGGLLKVTRNACWMGDLNRQTLFQYAGPVDAPFDTSSSIPYKLHGYASAFLFIDCLPRFWGLRHSCRARGYVMANLSFCVSVVLVLMMFHLDTCNKMLI